MFKYMNLFKGVSIRVLRFLAEHPGKEFYERQVSREAGVSIGAANQVLRDLAKSDIVTRERRGRMFFYKYDLANPVSREFKVLFNILSLKDLVFEIKGDCKEIILFGSSAAGEDRADSDIDLFIHTSKKQAVTKKVLDFESKLGRELSPTIVDSEEYAKTKSGSRAFIERVKRGRVLWQD